MNAAIWIEFFEWKCETKFINYPPPQRLSLVLDICEYQKWPLIWIERMGKAQERP